MRLHLVFCYIVTLLSPVFLNAQAFFKVYGTADRNERGYGVCDAGDGNLYLSGSVQDSALILKVTPDGDLLWARSFKFIPGFVDHIAELRLDADGLLVGCGSSGLSNSSDGFAFRYDPEVDTLAWAIRLDKLGFTYGILERENRGNFLVYANPSGIISGDDAKLIELDRKTGAPTPALHKRYHLGASDAFRSMVLYQGDLYACGRYTDGNTIVKMRHAVSRLDGAGHEKWSRLSYVPGLAQARLFGHDLLIDQDNIVSVGAGDDLGASLDETTIYLQKMTLDGDLLWAKKYDLPAFDNEIAEEVIQVKDGYVIFGRDRRSPADLFFLKTDRDGTPLWAKRFDYAYNDVFHDDGFLHLAATQSQVLAFDNYLFATAVAQTQGGASDIILLKLDQQGQAGSPCPYFSPTQVVTTALVDPENAVVDLTTTESPATAAPIPGKSRALPMPVAEKCGCQAAKLDLGPDVVLCADSAVTWNAGPGFVQYLWQDGSTSQTLQAEDAGIYWVEVLDSCGNTQRDSVLLTFSLLADTQFPDTLICPGAALTYTVPGFDAYQWAPAAGLSCTNCPTVTIQPASTTLYTLVAKNAQGCILRDTFLVAVRATSNLKISCPANLTVQAAPGANNATVTYGTSTVLTDCPCGSPTLSLAQGPASGSSFPVGNTQVCYKAQDGCGSQASCCFTVTVVEQPAGDMPCDVKITPCVKFEILGIYQYPSKQKLYRMRVTNNCQQELLYVAYALPDGFTAADAPAGNSVYTAPSGRQYTVRNPNGAPFPSIRFKTNGIGIANGQSDIFEYTLPPQADPTFIQALARLEPQVYYETHLNVFACEVHPIPANKAVGQPAGDRGLDAASQPVSRLRVFPNPAHGQVMVDLTAWEGKTVQIRLANTLGQLVLEQQVLAETAPVALDVPETCADGIYLLEATMAGQEKRVARLLLKR